VSEEYKKAAFEIYQHIVDLDVLYGIKGQLGYGEVYKDNTVPIARYSLTRGHHHKIIEVFNNRIKCEYKYEQFYR
jgi:hypothetical protein